MKVGDYVQLRHRDLGPPVRRKARGEVCRIDGDWATVKLPGGGFFQAHNDNLTVIVRVEDQ